MTEPQVPASQRCAHCHLEVTDKARKLACAHGIDPIYCERCVVIFARDKAVRQRLPDKERQSGPYTKRRGDEKPAENEVPVIVASQLLGVNNESLKRYSLIPLDIKPRRLNNRWQQKVITKDEFRSILDYLASFGDESTKKQLELKETALRIIERDNNGTLEL